MRTAFALLLICLTSTAYARYLSAEPHSGTLGPGKVVLVDNGKCGAGKVLQLTGVEGASDFAANRHRKCIEKPDHGK